nr:hypothetical protein [Tanacetum cinerariifolium]
MTTLAEFMIGDGADNRPPMLDKQMYDSWKSQILLIHKTKLPFKMAGLLFSKFKEDKVRMLLERVKILEQRFIVDLSSRENDVGDVEFQDNWGQVWVDIGTSDYFALDVLLNCLTVLSSEYLGIQQVVFGGQSMGDWEEGMKNPKDGYKSFKI